MNRYEMSFDTLLKTKWNSCRTDQLICEEQTWDLCRLLESNGYLQGNRMSIGANSIGPFRIAYGDIKKMDILQFFIEELIPALISINSNLTFENVYSFYLIPAAMLCVKTINNTFLIRDPLEWELLLYIKEQNEKKMYPTIKEIIETKQFSNIDRSKLYNAYKCLLGRKSMLDPDKKLVSQDHNGKIESNV